MLFAFLFKAPADRRSSYELRTFQGVILDDVHRA
jgi:hypothetical protein